MLVFLYALRGDTRPSYISLPSLYHPPSSAPRAPSPRPPPSSSGTSSPPAPQPSSPQPLQPTPAWCHSYHPYHPFIPYHLYHPYHHSIPYQPYHPYHLPPLLPFSGPFLFPSPSPSLPLPPPLILRLSPLPCLSLSLPPPLPALPLCALQTITMPLRTGFVDQVCLCHNVKQLQRHEEMDLSSKFLSTTVSINCNATKEWIW